MTTEPLNALTALRLARETGATIRRKDAPHVEYWWNYITKAFEYKRTSPFPLNGYIGTLKLIEIFNPDGSPVEWEVVATNEEQKA